MATNVRVYEYPFVVEKSKVNRLVTIIQENITKDEVPHLQKFTVNLSRGSTYEAESLDKIFELVNPLRNRITNFEIHIATPKESPEKRITVLFASEPRPFMCLMIASDNISWMTQVFSLIEEQLERMYQFHNQIVARIMSSPFIPVLLSISMLITIFINVLPQIVRQPANESSYWLTRSDINELDKILKSKDTLTNEDLLNILTRQIRNVIDKELHYSSILVILSDLRIIFIALPIVIIVVSLIYLTLKCYPPVVYLWGDMEDWHQTIINRRKTIWNVVIWALLVGIVGNLFVFGVTDFLRP